MIGAIQNRTRILGINERNFEYVKKYNSQDAQEIADDKLLTKQVLEAADVPVTTTLKVIKSHKQLRNFDFTTLPRSFVVKPVSGVEGGGIEIIFNRDKYGNYVCSGGKKISEDTLRTHISYILEGRFSHSYSPDIALIEERVQPHKKFRPYIYKGTPDIRVLVFRGVPTMAMIRWPTKESEGKANLSKGAVGSGIDLATGVTTHSMQEDARGRIHIVEYVNNSHVRYSGFRIPYWEKILVNAIKAARASGLGFVAVDFLIDRKNGPLIVELNARPGLRIQITNQDGLRWRLEQLRYLPVKSDVHAIRLGKDLFGGEVEEEIQAIAGKKLISLIQPVKLYHKNGIKSTIVKAKVDTGAGYSSIDTKLARELGFKKEIDAFNEYDIPKTFKNTEEARAMAQKLDEELLPEYPNIANTHVISSSSGVTMRISVNVTCKIQGQEYVIEANIRDRSHLKFPMILGKRALKHFLVDPSRK